MGVDSKCKIALVPNFKYGLAGNTQKTMQGDNTAENTTQDNPKPTGQRCPRVWVFGFFRPDSSLRTQTLQTWATSQLPILRSQSSLQEST